MNSSLHTRAGTIGGTLTILLANIHSPDIMKTAVLAAVGASVSFVISQVLKRVIQWVDKKPRT